MSKIDELKKVMDQREEGYGGSEKTLTRIGVLWGAYLSMSTEQDFVLAPHHVADMMVLFKIARPHGQDTSSAKDDKMDAAGYAILAAETAFPNKENNNG